MGKTIFTINPHSVIDVITNSSSELFVGKGSCKEIMIELITNVYPDYLNEYEEILSIDELSPSRLNNYFYYACSPHCWPASKFQYPVLPGFTFEELYEKEDEGKPAWNGQIQYRLKNNVISPTHKWHNDFITDENIEAMKDKLDPKREMFFLYSIDENPDWDHQEMLMNIMERHHLG